MKNIFKGKLLLVLAVVITSCTEDYFIESGTASGVVNMTSYDYLSAHPNNFSELVKVIDQTDRKALVNQDNVTLFALQNESILNYLGSMDYGSVAEANVDDLDSLLQKYIIVDAKMLRNSITSGLGDDVVTANAINMNVKIVSGEYKGVQNVGAKNIIYTDADLYASLKADKKSTTSAEVLVTSGDIQTTNGVVHVLDHEHKFGF
ncbi:fasciclin domain-containing protein [Reichenbachiella sp. MALMAid0571]|uniref:fasciclin domain-containing protein n=1 Tax=Reichenbachiella sp. MALMAid0571 TaxID=3143939 RepID=UPI0032DFDED5